MNENPRVDLRGEGHVTHWLGAYLDGEVSAALRQHIQEHLAACPACQVELDQLRALSSLLQSSPAPLSPTSDAAFARQVVDRITRPAPGLGQRLARLSWSYAPLFLFAAWAFIQAVSWISDFVLAGLAFLPGAQDTFLALLPFAGALDNSLLNELLRMSLLNPLVNQAYVEFGWVEPIGAGVLFNLIISLVLAGLFAAWLASWWAYHRARSSQV